MSSDSPPVRKPRSKALMKRPGPRPSLTFRLADGALVLAFLALTFLLGVFPLKDTDFWWHLRTGDLIRQTGRIPHKDLYTFTVPDAPWIDLHWGFQVAVSWVYERGGIVALNLAKCAVTCLAVGLLIAARRREWPVWAMVLAWLPALLLLGGRMYVRPETLSLLYLSAFLAVLSRWDRFPGLALFLPIVQVAWVNTQGLFVLGPVVLVFALIAAALRPGAWAPGRSRWWRIIGLGTFLTALACFVNPYGLEGALYPLQLARTMRNPIFANTIAELMPIPQFIQEKGLRDLPLQLHFTTLALGALSFLIPAAWALSVRWRSRPTREPMEKAAQGKTPLSRRGKNDAGAPARTEPAGSQWIFRLLLYLAFSALSLQATRNSHQFAAVVGALTAWNFGEWAAALRRRREERGEFTPPGLGAARRLLAFGAIGGVFALVASGQFYVWAGEGRTVGLGEEPLWYPHEAVKFAGKLGMPTRCLAFHMGNASLYEYYHGPERKVFADARLEVMGPGLYERYLNLERRISTGDPSWPRVLDDMERPSVVTDHLYKAPVGAAVLGDPSWRCVWFDPVAAVFVHRASRGVVEAHGVDFAARHFQPEPAAEPHGAPALLASAKALTIYAGSLQKQARPDLARPLVLLGLDYARRVRQAEPDGLDGWKEIGKLEMAREPEPPGPVPRFRLAFDPVFDLSTARATYALRRALEIAPRDFLTLHLLGVLYEQARGMHEAALPLLDRLLDLHPINRPQVLVQAEASAARDRILAAIGPEPPPMWDNLSALDRIVTDLLARGRAASAADFLERAYPREPRPWDVVDRLATLRLHLGEPERARRLWTQATSPPQPALRTARVAVTYFIEGDFETARRHYREARAADPNLFEGRYGLAVLEQDAGDADEAYIEARHAALHAPSEVARRAARTIMAEAAPFAKTREQPVFTAGPTEEGPQ